MGLRNFLSAEKDIYLNFTPATKNLFTVKIMGDDDKDLNTLAEFHATSVDIDDEAINMKRNEISKNFQIDENSGYTWASKLTIKWRENEDWKVKTLHEEWVSEIYDKEKDVFKSFSLDSNGPYKTFIIYLPNDKAIKCINVLPKNIGNISLAWSPSAGIVEHRLDYYLTKWCWLDHESEDDLDEGTTTVSSGEISSRGGR